LVLLISPSLRFFAHSGMAAGSYNEFLTRFYSPTHLRLDGLALGVVLAGARAYLPVLWSRVSARATPSAALGVAIIAAATWAPWLAGYGIDGSDRMALFPAVAGFALVSIGVGLAIPLAVQARIRATWIATPAVFVADHAYALYLTHEQAIGVAGRAAAWWGLGFWPALGIAAALSLGVAVVLRRMVEIPALSYRDRWLGHRRR
jgi:peptidoglycan/LPS O-acetylase OafA/YrhL